MAALFALYHCFYNLFCCFGTKLFLKTVHFYIACFTAFLGFLFCLAQPAHAQYKIQGTVLDSSRIYPLEAVSVLSTSGKGTQTDANGFYQIDVSDKDSIWFSYLGKPTMKFPVLKITTPLQFDIALRVNIPVLTEVKIRPRNYRQDSLQNRQDYARVFNFHRPNLGSMTSIGPSGAGFDIDEMIRVFQFRKNKNMERFQSRLLQQEQEKYIDHRFNKQLVRRLTGLDGAALDEFMRLYRPSLEFTIYASDYDYQQHIKEAYEKYKAINKGF